MNELNRPDKIQVSADHTPGEHRTDSDDAFTGTGCIFEPGECCSVTRRAGR